MKTLFHILTLFQTFLLPSLVANQAFLTEMNLNLHSSQLFSLFHLKMTFFFVNVFFSEIDFAGMVPLQILLNRFKLSHMDIYGNKMIT